MKMHQCSEPKASGLLYTTSSPTSVYCSGDAGKLNGKDDSFKEDQAALVLSHLMLLQWGSGSWAGNYK